MDPLRGSGPPLLGRSGPPARSRSARRACSGIRTAPRSSRGGSARSGRGLWTGPGLRAFSA